MSDRVILKKMAAAVNVQPTETVLEIGPGHGELTVFLLKAAKAVIAIEKDATLCSFLARRFSAVRTMYLIHGNVLHELKQLRFDVIVSNLPYAICEPLFQKLPAAAFRAAFFTLPVTFSRQLERPPYSFLFERTELFSVPRCAFSPPPRTRSVFVRVVPRKTILSSVLSMRRSKLKNAIVHSLTGMTKRQVREKIKRVMPSAMLEMRVADLGSGEYTTLRRIFRNCSHEFK